MNRPNILYIHSHDTGRMIQPHGYAVSTPHLQQLAETGVLFRQNFCVNPTCSPSRAALLTGSYPHENGMLGLAHRGFALHDYRHHMVHTLKAAGYLTLQTGIQHIVDPGGHATVTQVIGYDRHLPGAPDDAAVAFLDAAPEQPFFMAVGMWETHREFPALDESGIDPNYCLPADPLPDTPATRIDMARYKASVKRLDEGMGAVFEALDRNGLAENTLVICTTDHGIAFPRMKCHLQDSGIGTFLIMRGPGGFGGGAVIDSMTSHLDIFPTLCDLLELEPPSWLRGKSLLPLVRGEVDMLHDALCFEINFHAAYEPMRAVRTARWKYIRSFDPRNRPVLPNCDDGESKSVWMDAGWPSQPVPPVALFDLVFDPHEAHNLIDNDAYSDIADTLRERLDAWMRETADPLLDGPLVAPPGARINDSDGLSPQAPTLPLAP